MRFFSTLNVLDILGLVSVSALRAPDQVGSERALFKLVSRDRHKCDKHVRPGASCAERCGGFYDSCGSDDQCYNTNEQICCNESTICAAGSQCSDNGCISNNEPSQTDLEPSQEPTEEPPTSAEPTETGEPNPTEVFSSEDTAVTDEPTTSEVFTASDQTQNDPSTEPETITTDSPSITSTLPINTDTSTTTLENPTSSGAAALYAEGACVAILGGLLANVLLT